MSYQDNSASRGDLVTAFSDAIRDNPVPAALIGMGALWLFMGGGKMTLGRGGASLAGAVADGTGSMVHGAGDMAGDLAHRASRTLRKVTRPVTETVSHAAEGLAETVSDAAGRVGDYVGSSLHGVDAQSEYRNPAFSSGNSLRGSLTDMFERHPMALGVAGLALGAAVAASLPLTATERDSLGAVKDTMREKLGEAAEQARDMASAAAQEIAR